MFRDGTSANLFDTGLERLPPIPRAIRKKRRARRPYIRPRRRTESGAERPAKEKYAIYHYVFADGYYDGFPELDAQEIKEKESRHGKLLFRAGKC